MSIVNYETKKDALFLETVVLVNGESDPEMYKDSQGDVWDSKTIGQVFTTEANQTNHDLYHNKNKIEGIQTIANYRNKSVEIIGGREVPINSWRKDIMVTDNEVIELIKSNEINGVSPNNRLQECPICISELKNIKGNIFYNSDIENKECMNPIFTSLVPDPSNGYGMNVYSYDKFLEKSRSSGGDKLSNKLKEMFKGFGESVINYADGIEDNEQKEKGKEMNKADEETSNEDFTLEDVKNVVEEAVKPLAEKVENIEKEVSEIKGEETEEVESEEGENPESQKSADVVKEEDSIDDRRDDIRKAIIEKDFADREDDYDIWIALMAEDCVVIEDYKENKYLKYDYGIDGDTISIGESVEVELQYAVKGATTEEESTEETVPESQKSNQPNIRSRSEKLESIEMEKQNEQKVNHLGMPIKSTKDLAKGKNQFNF